MSKPTSASVTEVPCSCGYLAASAHDPNLPVKFDAELNEYCFEHKLSMGTKVVMMFYHCPMCGGVASESQRQKLFAIVSDDEVCRLDSLIGNIEVVSDIERVLNAPDDDEAINLPADVGAIQRQAGELEARPIRVLTYSRLSETADVQFTVYSNGKIEKVIAPKHESKSQGTGLAK
jgi:hypothetical protein